MPVRRSADLRRHRARLGASQPQVRQAQAERRVRERACLVPGVAREPAPGLSRWAQPRHREVSAASPPPERPAVAARRSWEPRHDLTAGLHLSARLEAWGAAHRRWSGRCLMKGSVLVHLISPGWARESASNLEQRLELRPSREPGSGDEVGPRSGTAGIAAGAEGPGSLAGIDARTLSALGDCDAAASPPASWIVP